MQVRQEGFDAGQKVNVVQSKSSGKPMFLISYLSSEGFFEWNIVFLLCLNNYLTCIETSEYVYSKMSDRS